MFLPSTITLKPGDSGEFVAELQRRLVQLDLYPDQQDHGQYDSLTTMAVREFQSMTGLKADGIAGPATLRRLNNVLSGSEDDDNIFAAEEEDQQLETHNLQQVLQEQVVIEAPDFFDIGEAATGHSSELAPQTAAIADSHKPVTEARVAENIAHAEPGNIQREQNLLKQQIQADNVALANDQQLLRAAANAEQIAPEMLAAAENKQQEKPLVAKPPPRLNAEPAASKMDEQVVAKTDPAEIKTEANLEQKPEVKPTPQPEQQVAAKAARNPVVQKIIDYLEAKMPKEIVREVLREGMNMLHSGVREAPIPGETTAAQVPTRGPELPTKAPEQTAQRG